MNITFSDIGYSSNIGKMQNFHVFFVSIMSIRYIEICTCMYKYIQFSAQSTWQILSIFLVVTFSDSRSSETRRRTKGYETFFKTTFHHLFVYVFIHLYLFIYANLQDETLKHINLCYIYIKTPYVWPYFIILTLVEFENC